MSDVHLEFRTKQRIPTIIPCATNLALLGDIGKPFTDRYNDFIQEQSAQFEKVFVVMGNHEYYTDTETVDMILDKAKEICKSLPNVYLLERESYRFPADGYTLLGCTLWSDINPSIAEYLNDFNKIHVFDKSRSTKKAILPSTYISWHKRDVKWLEESVANVAHTYVGDKVIVLTHHAPLKDMSGRYNGSVLSSAFVTDLRHLFKKPVHTFANGHVHSNCDIMHNNIRCVSNAMGYPGENTAGYKTDVVVPFH